MIFLLSTQKGMSPVDSIVLLLVLGGFGYFLIRIMLEIVSEKQEPPREDWMAKAIANHTGESPDQVEKRIVNNVENLKKAFQEIIEEKEKGLNV